jgi:hypothetical protein
MSPIITSCKKGKRKGVTVILSLKARVYFGFTLITLTLAIGLLSSILRGGPNSYGVETGR